MINQIMQKKYLLLADLFNFFAYNNSLFPLFTLSYVFTTFSNIPS